MCTETSVCSGWLELSFIYLLPTGREWVFLPPRTGGKTNNTSLNNQKLLLLWNWSLEKKSFLTKISKTKWPQSLSSLAGTWKMQRSDYCLARPYLSLSKAAPWVEDCCGRKQIKGTQVVSSPALSSSKVSTKLKLSYLQLSPDLSLKLPRKRILQSTWAACSSSQLSPQQSHYLLPVWTSLTPDDVHFLSFSHHAVV